EKRLHDREETLQIREQAVDTTEQELRRRMEAVAEARRHQESYSARLAAHEAIWTGERDRLIASVRAREDVVEQRLAALIDLGERWSKRRQRQVIRLRAQRNACEALRREEATLRQEWVQRSTLLVKEQ